MIATRQRRKRRPKLRSLLLPLAAIAALAFAVTWPPSHNVLANGPLKPAFNAGANVASVVGRPLTFAVQQQTITDKNREIRTLSAQLDTQRQAKNDADARAQRLQQQLGAAANQPKPTPVPAVRKPLAQTGAAGALAGTGPAPSSSAAPPTDEEKRLAATWAAMEPEKAAAIIQRLPDDQVVRVLAAMDPDSAAGILNALPAAVAARISRAQVPLPSGR